MLLRLLPSPSASQPTPPTILFTLPMPNRPFTSRSLPLPPNLMAHRSVCLQEDIECPNTLLGEKSSWISGVIDDVTFSLPQGQVSVHLIDGTTLTFPLTSACTAQLQRVIHQVQLSFAPKPDSTSRTITSIASSASSSAPSTPTRPSLTVSPGRSRSPSALLLSLLSPILPINQAQPTLRPSTVIQQPPARVHRRQARSFLVDTYRRHVLPLVKEHLPDAYLPWAIASEISRRLEEFEALREEINATLATAGIDHSTMGYTTPSRRRRASSCSSSDSDSDSDSDGPSPVTPGTSVFPPSACSTPPRKRAYQSPQAFLLAIPPAHVLPPSHRNAYSTQLARLTQIASRLSAVRKLNAKYEREEGKRRWLESLERGRAGDKALRRAFSNGHMPRGLSTVIAEPVKASRLWRSWTAADGERSEHEADQAIHPAMMAMDAIEEVSSSDQDSENGSASDEEALPRPFTHLSSSTEAFIEDKVILVRPPLLRVDTEVESDDETPSLTTSGSDDSLADRWDIETPMEGILLPAPLITSNRWILPPLPPSPKLKCVEIDWANHNLHQDVEGVYA